MEDILSTKLEHFKAALLQDLIPPQNGSLHVHVETFIFEISKIGNFHLR